MDERDFAKSLRDPRLVQARRAFRKKGHLAPLASFVDRLRAQAPAGVPDFDPLDGGVEAECLFLLEAPGARAIGSGFVSRNNPDETASNFFHLNAEAGLDRTRTLIWNAIPWYIGNGSRIRPATSADIGAAEEHLRELLRLLPRLKIIVLLGRKAQRHAPLLQSLSTAVILTCPHPSPLSLNGRPHRRLEILTRLKDVLAILGSRAD